MLGANPQAPQARNPSQELTQSLRALVQNEPLQYAADVRYQPLYGQLNLADLYQQMMGYNVPGQSQGQGQGQGLPAPGFIAGSRTGGANSGLTRRGQSRANTLNGIQTGPGANGTSVVNAPGYHPGTIGLNTIQRSADIADVMRLGPSATASVLNANPWLAGGIQNLSSRLNDSPILQTLNQQALAQLQSNGQLSPQEQADLNNQTRAGFAQRGMMGGNQSLAADILSRDAATRARMAAAQQFATGVQGLNQNQNDLALRAPGVFSSTLSDPFMAILSRPSTTTPATAQSMFNPQSPYFQDLYNTNYNAQAAANIAGANNNAALWGGLIKDVGQVAGAAAMSDRRLKKNVRYTGEKTRSGLPIATFQYKDGKRSTSNAQRPTPKFRGVIAQDVEKKFPHAVRRLPGPKQFRVVNFAAIDAPFEFVKGKAA